MIKLELPEAAARTGKARIKIGASVFHDFGYFKWPGCKPPNSEFKDDEEYEYKTKYPDAIFEVGSPGLFNAEKPVCCRPGYGGKCGTDEYGNGPIHVGDWDDLEFIDDEDERK